MIAYYLRLAWRGLHRGWLMSALMVLAIGLGIGASMTMLTVLHVISNDPLPGRGARIYRPHLDPLPLDYQNGGYGPDPSINMTWPDAMALLQSHRAQRTAVMAGGRLLLRPELAGRAPFYAEGRYTTPDFFAMFGLRFRLGQAWSAADEQAAARVVVLSESLSRRVFGDENSVGRMVRLDETELRVVGVSVDWAPQPKFYVDAGDHAFDEGDSFFLPLSTAMALKFDTEGNTSSWASSFSGDRRGAAVSWLQVWVELGDAAQVRDYRQYLYDYSARQLALGRFAKPASSARLDSIPQWLAQRQLVSSDLRLQMVLALSFLLICLLNIVALLLAKFLRRGGEISVRRALGARRRDIFLQLGVESLLIGVAGGVLGLLLAQCGLWSVRQRPDDYARLAHMDGAMLAGTVLLAVLASVLAGLGPAWRACRIAPALQLKTY